MSRPPAVVVSLDSVKNRKPTPLPSSSVIVASRCGKDRPRRSRRHTTRVSPGSNRSRSRASSGRSSRAPEATSVQTCAHPAAVRASAGKGPGPWSRPGHSRGRVPCLGAYGNLLTRVPRHRGLGHEFRTPIRRRVAPPARLSLKRSVLFLETGVVGARHHLARRLWKLSCARCS